MLKKFLALFAAALLITSAAACSSKSDEKTTAVKETVKSESEQTTEKDNTSNIIEPVDLISKEEAEELVGISLKEAKITKNDAVGMKIAFYDSADEKATDYVQVSISQEALMAEKVLKGGQSPKTIYEATKEAFPERTGVKGVGDDAFINNMGIHILKGEYYINISIGKHNDDELLVKAGIRALKHLK
jgi:hypothetical protein